AGPVLDDFARPAERLKTRAPEKGGAPGRNEPVDLKGPSEQPVDLKGPSPGGGDAVSPSLRSAKPLRIRFWLGTGIRFFILLLVGGLVVLVAHEWNWWVSSAVQQSTDDAYLQSDMTPLAARVSGYVRTVPVQDFQKVKAGDLLVEIVDDDYRAQVAQAQANVAAAQAAIDNIEQQKLLQQTLIRQAEATIRASQADLTRFHLEAV